MLVGFGLYEASAARLKELVIRLAKDESPLHVLEDLAPVVAQLEVIKHGLIGGSSWRTGIQDSWAVEEIVAHSAKTLFRPRGILATLNAHRAALKSNTQALHDVAPRLGMDSEAQAMMDIHTLLAKQCDVTITESALLHSLTTDGNDEAKSMAIHKQLDQMSDRHFCDKDICTKL